MIVSSFSFFMKAETNTKQGDTSDEDVSLFILFSRVADQLSVALLIHLEACVACSEVSVDLLGSGNTGIDVGLGCLGTHFLRS